MQKIEQILRKLGFSEHEIIVYRMLLLKGSSLSVSDISTATGLYRPAIYLALGVLLNRQVIVQVVRGKRKEYAAESPEKLRGMINEIRVDVEEVIPDLQELYTLPKEKPLVRLLEGKKGIASVFDDLVETLKRGDVFYRYSSRLGGPNESFYPKDYRKRRDAKGLEWMIITTREAYKTKKPHINEHVKFVPGDSYPFNQDIIVVIYADKVATIDRTKQTAIIIQNRQLAEFQKTIFKLLHERL